MAKKEVTTLFATPWKPTNKNDRIEGAYLGLEMIPSKQGNDSDSFVSYRLRKADGTIWGIAGAMLDDKLGQIPVGTGVEIVFLGMTKLPSGRSAKDFKVLVDETVQLIDPHAVAAAAQNNGEATNFPPTAHA